ncbi:MAG: 50S ribosomal protein L11 [Candidatus Absconditabacteria bacterium]
MAGGKKPQKVIKLHMVAGKATPTPPVGPILGQSGLNIGQVVKEFNDKTADLMKSFGGFTVKVPALISVYADRTYSMTIGTPLTSHLILWKAGLKKGSGEPNKKKAGKISYNDIKEIAEMKLGTVNTKNIDSIIKSVEGTAKSLGIEVVK